MIVIKRFGFKKVLLTSTKKRFGKISLPVKRFFSYRRWLFKSFAFLIFLAEKNNYRSPLLHEDCDDVVMDDRSMKKYPSSSYVDFLKKIN